MMFALAPNVVDDSFAIGLAHRKGPVPALPMKAAKLSPFGFDPLRRAGFDGFNDIGDWACPRETKEEVNVIAYATNLDRRTA